jgi:hypothetical protein
VHCCCGGNTFYKINTVNIFPNYNPKLTRERSILQACRASRVTGTKHDMSMFSGVPNNFDALCLERILDSVLRCTNESAIFLGFLSLIMGRVNSNLAHTKMFQYFSFASFRN